MLLVNPYLVRERGISLKSEDLLGSPISEHELVLLLEADYEAEGESGDIRGLAGRMFSSLFGENGLLGALSGERGKGAPVELGELYRLYRKPDTAAKVRVVSGEGGEVSVPEWVCQEVDWVSPGAQEAKNRGWRGGGKVYLRIGRAIRKVSRKILGDGPWRTVEDELLSRVHEVAMEALENLSKTRGRPGEATCEDGGREARGTRLSLESGTLEVRIKETRGTPERGGARFIREWDISGRIIDEFVKRESKISKWLERTPGVGFRSTVDMLLEEAGGGGGTWPSSMSLEVVGNGEGKTAMVVIPYVYKVQSLRSGSKKAVVGVGLKLLIVRALKDVSEHVERVDLSVKEERLRTEGIVGWRESPIREIIKAYRPEVVEAYARRREAPGGPGSGCPVDRGHIPVTFFVGNGGDEKSFGTGYSVGVHETYVYYDRESGREVVLGYQSPSAYVSVTDEGVLLYSSSWRCQGGNGGRVGQNPERHAQKGEDVRGNGSEDGEGDGSHVRDHGLIHRVGSPGNERVYRGGKAGGDKGKRKDGPGTRVRVGKTPAGWRGEERGHT